MITMPTLSSKEKILLAGVIFLIFILLYSQRVYGPMSRRNRELRKEAWGIKHKLDTLKFEFVDIKAEEARLFQAKKDYQASEKELKSREDKLFNQAQLGTLLRKITQSAASHQLDFISITPKKKQDQELYLRFPIEIKLSSPYSGFLNYLKEVENISEVLKVKELDIEMDKTTSFNPTALIKLSTVLSDKVTPGEGAKMISLPSSGTELFASQVEVKTEEKLEGVELNGIIWKGGESSAIINNQVVRVGSAVGKKKILEITQDEVVLGEGEAKYTLKLKK